MYIFVLWRCEAKNAYHSSVSKRVNCNFYSRSSLPHTASLCMPDWLEESENVETGSLPSVLVCNQSENPKECRYLRAGVATRKHYSLCQTTLEALDYSIYCRLKAVNRCTLESCRSPRGCCLVGHSPVEHSSSRTTKCCAECATSQKNCPNTE